MPNSTQSISPITTSSVNLTETITIRIPDDYYTGEIVVEREPTLLELANNPYDSWFNGRDSVTYYRILPAASTPLYIRELPTHHCQNCLNRFKQRPGTDVHTLSIWNISYRRFDTFEYCSQCWSNTPEQTCSVCSTTIKSMSNAFRRVFAQAPYGVTVNSASSVRPDTAVYVCSTCYGQQAGNLNQCGMCLVVSYFIPEEEHVWTTIAESHHRDSFREYEDRAYRNTGSYDTTGFEDDSFFEAIISSQNPDDTHEYVDLTDLINYIKSVSNLFCRDCLVRAALQHFNIPSVSDRARSQSIQSYSFKPDAKFFSLGDEKDTELYFGVELETEMRSKYQYNSELVAAALNKNVPNFIYCKYDGSLSNGFEIVSHPATFNYWKNNTVYFDALNGLTKYCRSFRSDSCGIHIHMSKNAFSGLHLAHFLHFMYNNPAFVEFIAQRTANAYASFVPEERNSVLVRAKQKRGNYERYTVVNLQNEATIEIRIFKGNLRPDAFMKNIEFCKALFDFTNPDELDSFNVKYEAKLDSYINGQSVEFNRIMASDYNVGNFIKFVSDNQETYPNLYLRLKEGDKVDGD